MKKLGVDAAKCTLIAVASGLIGLCGATIMYCASAIAAIFFIVRTPPQQQISGCRKSRAWRSISCLNS